ncbi:4Fe-4S dicluster domain-containing protein [Desulfobacula sp.]|nr:4Fe-4S dicluster domain-containing protein [Desulfobacula sp.]
MTIKSIKGCIGCGTCVKTCPWDTRPGGFSIFFPLKFM